ncbi:ABC transporter ATP-binding protein [Methanobacterium petrolearium]|uniref:ABC transporter ATP-binding protein n=1 Tax=Methanobacterium petrolearium TaxID=710190 RepID=UPI001AE1EDFD|nr:ABC transporter ATP-binding protein [Methanobacterium petrolearium]MBP1946950.1 energy-coupling factor transport system ATP-binding protein [Methanobacterium petrolearium]BDZ70908.1 putative ABC transporter ATP-binding protein [Methanobacterium petrolearium]
MSLIKFEDFSFKYPHQKNALSNINLDINDGEFVLFCGPSGSGKTTLLANIKNEIRPVGDCDGVIYYDGENIRNMEDERSASEIGFLFQNPEDQFVSDNVLQEIAFSLENMGLPTNEIRNRVAEMTAFFGLDKYLYKNVNELSGGQKQLVNLCSLLVLKPKLLLLDEPTSQLDPIAAYDFLTILRRLNEEFSITIMATEHKIDNMFPFIDKAVFLEDGCIKYSDGPRSICQEAWNNEIFSNYLPAVTRINFLLGSKYDYVNELKIPLNIRQGRGNLNLLDGELKKSHNSLSTTNYKRTPDTEYSKGTVKENENTLIKCDDIWFGYIQDHLVLKGINFDIKKGEFLSIIGGNGTGKSTLLQILAGLMKPKKGKITYKKGLRLGYVHQNPMIHFRQETVEEEFSEYSSGLTPEQLAQENGGLGKLFRSILGSKDHSDSAISPAESSKLKSKRFASEEEKQNIIHLFGLEDLMDKHPYDCSGGEKQKIAIVKALLTKPDVLILDEPTKGIDPVSKLHFADLMKKLQSDGLTIVMTTHDIDFAAEYSHRCILLFDGGIQVDDEPKPVFSNNNFYTTFVNRMVKDYLPNCVTLSDVKREWNI